MKKLIKSLIKKVLSALPTKKIIVFESRPDLSDNTKAVFDEMIRMGLNKKYKMLWYCCDSKKISFPKLQNVELVYDKKSIYNYYLFMAKAVICCNRFVYSRNPKTVNFFLGHGGTIKNASSYYVVPDNYNYIFTSSYEMAKIKHNFYGCSMDKMVYLGYPRNDALTNQPINLQKYFGSSFKKIIVWYPTVRQFSVNNPRTNCKHALPIVWDDDNVIELNACAKNNNVLVVIKPHFAQDTSFIKKLNLSNVIIIDDSFFATNNITNYQFVGSCDALLTDFSSIYYDYTLCDKPIGLIWEDYEEYNQNPGFAVDVGKMFAGGVKIFTLADLESFILDVACDIDRLRKERRIIRDLVNASIEGDNTKKVTNFIIDKANL